MKKVRSACAPTTGARWKSCSGLQLLAIPLGSALFALTTPAGAQSEKATHPPADSTRGDSTSPKDASSKDGDARTLADKAKVEFKLGNEAYEQGNYRVAAEAFEQAHRLSPHSAVLFNAARAWWKMGESERAADDYAEAIRRGELTSEQTLRARSALASLRKKLGWIIVSGPHGTTVSVGHRRHTSLPLTTHLAPGDHVLYLQQNTDRWEQLITVQADAPLSVVAQKTLQPDNSEKERRETPAPPVVADGRGQRTFGWLTLGVGTALGAGAVVTGLFTLNARNEFNGLNDGTALNLAAAEERRREAMTWRTVTNVLAISGGAAALTGFTLLLTSPKQVTSQPGVRVIALSLGSKHLGMLGSF